ncbi:MAG TPA: S1/P1 nuclease, partial [Tepidisphaeraceae bacterium]|nr:S1/P1 nuclease [Tepidisphaeraceae bacterium]
MRLPSTLAVLFLVLIFPQLSLAWNETGHMTVALIAYRQLSDAQKQKIATVLRAHPHYKLYLAAKVPPGVSEDEWAFMRSATWPDFIRPASSSDRVYKDPTVT